MGQTVDGGDNNNNNDDNNNNDEGTVRQRLLTADECVVFLPHLLSLSLASHHVPCIGPNRVYPLA